MFNIGIVAPASHGEIDALEKASTHLKALGFEVKWGDNVKRVHRYFAGTDEERVKAFHSLWMDPSIDAIWCIRGGYGSARILEFLDYDALKMHPKIFIGMSDITALHIALNQQCNLKTFLGPTTAILYGNEHFTPEDYSHRWLLKLFQAIDLKTSLTYEYPEGYDKYLQIISPGKAESSLVGGNLSIICSLIGTPWQLNTKGKILFLEDVNEKPYCIDRMLLQMKYAGMLESLSGVILSIWQEGEEEKDIHFREELLEVFKDFFSNKPYPVLFGFPCGHIKDQVTLPLNGRILLDADQKTVTVLN